MDGPGADYRAAGRGGRRRAGRVGALLAAAAQQRLERLRPPAAPRHLRRRRRALRRRRADAQAVAAAVAAAAAAAAAAAQAEHGARRGRGRGGAGRARPPVRLAQAVAGPAALAIAPAMPVSARLLTPPVTGHTERQPAAKALERILVRKPWPDLMQAPGWLPGRQQPCRRCSVQIREIRASARAACAALPQCCGAGRAARARARRARTASCSAAAQRAASASDSKASVTTSLPRRRRASSLYSVKENCAPRARPRCQLPSRARCAALHARRARRAKAGAGAPITQARRRAPGAGALQLGVLRPGRGCWAREQARGCAGRAHQLPVLVRARHERQQRVVAAGPQHAVAALPEPAQPVRHGQVPDLAQVRRAGRPARANPVTARVGQSVGLRPRQCCCSGSAPLVPLHAL